MVIYLGFGYVWRSCCLNWGNVTSGVLFSYASIRFGKFCFSQSKEPLETEVIKLFYINPSTVCQVQQNITPTDYSCFYIIWDGTQYAERTACMCSKHTSMAQTAKHTICSLNVDRYAQRSRNISPYNVTIFTPPTLIMKCWWLFHYQ